MSCRGDTTDCATQIRDYLIAGHPQQAYQVYSEWYAMYCDGWYASGRELSDLLDELLSH